MGQQSCVCCCCCSLNGVDFNQFDFFLIDLPCDRTGDGDFEDRFKGISVKKETFR